MESFISDLSLLLVGAALLSFLAVICKQPIIIAYILSGVLIGPWGAGLIRNVGFIEVISHLGITLLLFLAGLNLPPQKLMKLFGKTSLVTFINCTASFAIGFVFAKVFNFTTVESVVIGLAFMFSSTILAIKLLPTAELHHSKVGALCIGVLIMEDLLAIATLALIRCFDAPEGAILKFSFLTLKLILFIVGLVVFETLIMRRIMHLVDRLHETLFILGLAWCFGMANISHNMGLFYETGAFFSGVVLARHPISLFIADKLKPLRDFFLVMFFFSLGARLEIATMKEVIIPALVIALVYVVLKPLIFAKSFSFAGENHPISQEAGFRLGQLSEFALLIALLALELNHIGSSAFQLIQLVTIFTLIASSYIVIFKYPTPIGTSAKLTRE